MKETRTINLNGIIFHIDNDAYQALHNYLNDIELRMPTDERDDVMSDVEARVCELLQSALFAKNVQVVDIAMIDAIKAQIGAPAEFGENKRPKVRRTPQSERSGCGRVLKITLYVFLILIGLQIVIPVLGLIFAFCVTGLGLSMGAFSLLPAIGVPFFGGSWWMALLTILSAVVAIGLPIAAIIYTIVSWMRYRRGPKGRFWLIAVICWVLSVGFFSLAVIKQAATFGGINGLVHYVQTFDDEDDAETAAVTLPYFNAINAGGAVVLDINQGEVTAAETENHKDLVMEVKDSVLCISRKQGADGKCVVEITMPELTTLTLSGASIADVNGTFDEVHYLISGASVLDADDAKTDIVHVNCSGASKASVYAEKELWAQASGASKITYSGKPAVKRSMAVGASKIRKD